MTSDPDASLRRVQRDSAIIAAAAVLAALAIRGGRPDGALGVLAGAGLMAVSYTAIKGGVTALVRGTLEAGRGAPGGAVARGRVAWTLLKFVGRYAVIGLAAWAVLVPLGAHPLGLFAGVTVPVLAIGIEAVRLARAPAGRSS